MLSSRDQWCESLVYTLHMQIVAHGDPSVAGLISLAATRVPGPVRLPHHGDQCRQGPRDCQQSCLHLPAGIILPGRLKRAGYPAPPLRPAVHTARLAQVLTGRVSRRPTKHRCGRTGLLAETLDSLPNHHAQLDHWPGLPIRRHERQRRACRDNRGHVGLRSRCQQCRWLTRTAKLLPIHCPRVRAPNPQ
jgi:hypothetical protein